MGIHNTFKEINATLKEYQKHKAQIIEFTSFLVGVLVSLIVVSVLQTAVFWNYNHDNPHHHLASHHHTVSMQTVVLLNLTLIISILIRAPLFICRVNNILIFFLFWTVFFSLLIQIFATFLRIYLLWFSVNLWSVIGFLLNLVAILIEIVTLVNIYELRGNKFVLSLQMRDHVENVKTRIQNQNTPSFSSRIINYLYKNKKN